MLRPHLTKLANVLLCLYGLTPLLAAATTYEHRLPLTHLKVGLSAAPPSTGAPVASLSATTADFGNLPVGSSNTNAILLTNSGTANLSLSGVSFEGNSTFTTATDCGSILLPGASCIGNIYFTPLTPGDFTGALIFSTGLGDQRVSVSGSGLGAVMEWAPTPALAQSFPDTPVGDVATDIVLAIQNNGNLSGSLETPAILGANAQDFSISSNTCVSVAPGNACSISFRFSPLAIGPRTASVTLLGSILTLSGAGQGAIQYLVVGGGGGGGAAGGGGGGGVLAGSTTVQAGAPYTITVGAGGPAVWKNQALLNIDGNGGSSAFSNILALGGGAGATSYTGHGGGAVPISGTSYKGATGASGGGSGGNSATTGQVTAGGLGTPGQGFAGGSCSGAYGSPAGGGGGAGGAGTNASSSPGKGGIGFASTITGATVYFGGGGGGGSYSVGGASGGSGGGGNGSQGSVTAGSGTNGLGGGGGGNSGIGGSAGAGGSGAVIISQNAALPVASTTCAAPTITTSNGKRIYTFTTVETCTITF